MKNSAATGTKEALILAAVRLIADRGVHGVSLREINAAAGTKNHSAANYYFKDKNGLVAAILAYGANLIQQPTMQLLRKIDERLQSGEAVHARDVLIAGFGANVALIADPGFGLHHIRTLSRIVFEFSPEFSGAFNLAARPLYERMFAQLSQLEPERDKLDIRRSLILTGTASLHVAANFGMGNNTPLGDISLPSDENFILYAFNYFSAAYTSTPPPEVDLDKETLHLLDDVIKNSKSIPFPD